jgi:hypothetical protein
LETGYARGAASSSSQSCFLWERLPMAAEAFGEGWQPQSFRGPAMAGLLQFEKIRPP